MPNEKLTQPQQIQRIVAAVCRHFGISRRDIRKHVNAWRISRPRMVAQYLIRQRFPSMPYIDIAAVFDQSGPTHAWHACEVIKRELETEATLRAIIRELS